MEKNSLNTLQQSGEEKVMDSEFVEMVLNKALSDFRKEQLLKEIDQSLLEQNKEKFLRLTEKLKSIS
ncbi:IDEAL domain-containing protein [Metabacillus litoralis]|jgi:uncharacterized protein YpiB (UPF0302 family)|uniref:IDEAL domain-containing protein n=1 Tax=Metabacillus litoralis TaxID=152268 RepID=UPI002040B0B1|nr:IDEAL domain-containing protein [Metabacillus litoralis]MCM3651031.1 IDEAL domain-containing protein [Metabacillus litoralis]